jgi:hypothetical protein
LYLKQMAFFPINSYWPILGPQNAFVVKPFSYLRFLSSLHSYVLASDILYFMDVTQLLVFLSYVITINLKLT